MTSGDIGEYISCMTEPRRRHYGIAEIAAALGLNRQLVTVWRRRRSWAMPEPDDELASGPLWLGSTIEPWIDTVRARLATGQQAEQLGPALVRQAGRRLLRLCALLLEDSPREPLVGRAYLELTETLAAVRDCAPTQEQMEMADALNTVTTEAEPAGAAEYGALRAACLTALTKIVPLLDGAVANPTRN
jgi:hypothetical protein